jgi:hypothetical protein
MEAAGPAQTLHPEVRQALDLYQAAVRDFDQLEKHTGVFGGANPQFSGRYRALMQEGTIRGIIAQFDQDRMGDWHEYYFDQGQLRYAYTKNIREEGHSLQTQRYFLDAAGRLRGLEINGQPVTPTDSPGQDLFTQAEREIKRLARQFYAIARLDQAEIPPALEAVEVISSAEMRGSPGSIPRAVPVNPSAAQGETALPETAAEAGQAAAQQVALNSAAGTDALSLEFQLLSRWADWANRTRADASERTPLPPDLLLDLSVPDPAAGAPEIGGSLDPPADPDPEEEAALAAFRESATLLESAGDPYVSNSNAIVRAGPGSSHRRIGLLEKGQTILVVTAVGEERDWYRVRLADTDIDAGDLTEGYIYATLLDPL